MSEGYHIYGNSGSGPIDYDSPIATVAGYANTAWVSPSLACPGEWAFGVRAFNANGDESNIDCSVAIDLDASGDDITDVPSPPTGLRAFATAGGAGRVEWWSPQAVGPAAPTGFRVYQAVGSTPSYGSAAATVAFNAGILNTFVANLAGAGGTSYAVAVRAFNASGEEQNTAYVVVTAVSTGPSAVVGLAATAVV